MMIIDAQLVERIPTYTRSQRARIRKRVVQNMASYLCTVAPDGELLYNGWTLPPPIVIDMMGGLVLDGNHRLEAAKVLRKLKLLKTIPTWIVSRRDFELLVVGDFGAECLDTFDPGSTLKFLSHIQCGVQTGDEVSKMICTTCRLRFDGKRGQLFCSSECRTRAQEIAESDPTPAEIKLRCEQIRKGWDAEDFEIRKGGYLD
ncbi:MAG: hypothetical protein ACYTG0_10920 [Planctomycetota bacterium]